MTDLSETIGTGAGLLITAAVASKAISMFPSRRRIRRKRKSRKKKGGKK